MKNLKILLLLSFLIFSISSCNDDNDNDNDSCSNETYNGDIELRSQQEVDDFGNIEIIE